MAVKVGSARIDENGRAHGGTAGDQTGKELSVQSWYRHSKGWRVLRCTDSAKAEKIAAAMEAACRNRNIGYDQYERLTLYNLAKAVGFDPARVAKPCETDCSALVRVCLAFAGIATENFRTPTQAKVMLATGQFVELTGKKYMDSSDYLRRGDVLVTRTQGHTVVVLSNGSKAGSLKVEHQLGDRLLKKGMSGSDVRELQQNLLKLGYALPKYGADGDYGAETVDAVKTFQKKSGLDTDGIYGSNTHKSLTAALEALKEPKPVLTTVVILSTEDGSVNVRAGNGTQYAILRSAKAGDTFNYVATAANGWNAVEIDNQVGWVSGRYSKII